MTFDQSKWVWKNGDLIPWQDATAHVSVHALHYGTGVFEGIRCYETDDGPAIFRLDVHLDRLYHSASIYGLEIPYNREQLTEAICQLIAKHEFRSCYIRPLVYYGSSSLSLHPLKCPVEVIILVWPWAPYLGAIGLEEGVRVTVSPWRKFHSEMMPTTVKACGQYVNSVLAVRDAVARGFDEAILLNRDGSVAEGSGENLFLVRNGEVLTNDETHSILLGVTRDAVIHIARELGYQVKTVALGLDDLRAADEAFFTGTAAEVTPIREVDDGVINAGRPGSITRRIEQAFFVATLGRNQRYKHWLYLVESTPLLGVR